MVSSIGDTNNMEEWKDIPGYEGLYQASSYGRIKGLKSGKILKQGSSSKDGRLVVALCKDGVPKTHAVHVVIAITFIPQVPNKPWVLHDDGNYTNNHKTNLKWGTPQENSDDMVKHGNSQKGAKHYKTKFTEQDVINIRQSMIGTNNLAKQYGVTRHTIMRVRRGVWG